MLTLASFGFGGHAEAQLGDLIYPKKSINENIDNLESATRRLIELFGKTVDEQTLQLLARSVQAIDALKISYRDSLRSTFDEISKERQADFYALASILNEANAAVSKNVGEISDIEKRLSNTLIRLSRASQEPWLLSYSPVAFLLGRPTDLPIRVNGQNLQHPRSRLLINGQELPVAAAAANAADFIVPRSLLVPKPDGLIHGKLALVSPQAPAFWQFWKPEETIEYQLLLRPLGQRLGTYSVEARVVDSSTIGQSLSQDSQGHLEE